MTTTIVVIFLVVYLGMILGELPFLQLDRTGVALLGAIALISFDAVSLQDAAEAVHLPTIILLFSFMVVSAQMRLGGFYDWVTRRIAALPLSPPQLLGALMAVVAALSAVFSNDIICIAVAPVLINACLKRRLDPVPYLLADRSDAAAALRQIFRGNGAAGCARPGGGLGTDRLEVARALGPRRHGCQRICRAGRGRC